MLFVWPVGIPLLYAILLWASRHALRKGIDTSLSRATAFLSEDCAAMALELHRASFEHFAPLEVCLSSLQTIMATGLRLPGGSRLRCVAN
mmetsp:Transcript_31967/g.87559  ORF Transcript_31967/g.87559 Transcript_31967/m.87559 type:complete len:90 (-) Transcript_31967:157-426(-)